MAAGAGYCRAGTGSDYRFSIPHVADLRSQCARITERRRASDTCATGQAAHTGLGPPSIAAAGF